MSNGKTKVILFFPSPSRKYPWTRIPLPILATGSLLPSVGYEPVFVSAKDENWKDKIVREAENAVFVGISAMTGFQITEGLEAAALVRQRHPQVPLVWGGRHPTLLPKQTIQHPLVDMVVKGQGERVVVELADYLTKGNGLDISRIQGLFHKKGSEIFQNEERPIENPNNFPKYPYHLMNTADYVYPSEMGQRTLNYVSSIGCPHRCRFCAEVVAFKRKWMGLRAERVMEEWKDLVHNYQVDGIVIDDSNYFVDKQRALAIAEGILRENLKISYGFVNAHVNEMLRFNEAEWDLLRKSGLYGVLIGAESGSDDALKLIGKDVNVEGLVKVVKKCNKYDIKANLSFMIGLPRSASYNISLEQEIDDIVRLIRRCYCFSKNLEGYIFFYTPYPGSEFFLEAVAQGLKEPQSLEEWARFELNNPHLPFITEKIANHVNNINRSWQYLFTHYIRTPGYVGQKVQKGRTPLRRFAFWWLDYFGYLIAVIRWRFLFFKFPFEHALVDFVFKFNNFLSRRRIS